MSKEHEADIDIDEDEDDGYEDHEDDSAEKGAKTAEELAAEQKAQDEAEANEAAESAARAKAYRPASDDAKEKVTYKGKEVQVDGDTVPLKVFLEMKKDYKALKAERAGSALTNQSLSEIAEAAGIDEETTKKLVSVISEAVKKETLEEVDSRVKPIVIQKMTADSERFFNEDFEKTIVAKYPELADKKETFKKVAFSKDFLHLSTLEDIRKEFFPAAKRAVKEDSPEGGSKGAANKGSEEIDFSKVASDQDLHKKVIGDRKLREKYYAWKDSQGL